MQIAIRTIILPLLHCFLKFCMNTDSNYETFTVARKRCELFELWINLKTDNSSQEHRHRCQKDKSAFVTRELL